MGPLPTDESVQTNVRLTCSLIIFRPGNKAAHLEAISHMLAGCESKSMLIKQNTDILVAQQ